MGSFLLYVTVSKLKDSAWWKKTDRIMSLPFGTYSDNHMHRVLKENGCFSFFLCFVWFLALVFVCLFWFERSKYCKFPLNSWPFSSQEFTTFSHGLVGL